MSKIKKRSTPTPFATFPALFDDVAGTTANSVIVLESQQGGSAIFQSQPNITIENGEFLGELTFDAATIVNLSYIVTEATITAGDLELDLSLGTHFYFTHDEDITISFTNLPPADTVVAVVLKRIKDATTTPRAIDWAGSTPVFENIPDNLTQTSEGVDQIVMVSRDGGVTFNIGTAFDLQEV